MIYLPIEYLRCFQFNTILDCAPANTLDHISWYKHARILKVVVSISIPTSNIGICIVSHLRQLLDLLKFLIFANTVDLKCYPVTVLICILLLLIILRIFFWFLVFLCLFCCEKEMPIYIFYPFSMWPFALQEFSMKSYIVSSDVCLHLLNFKCLEGKDHTFFIVISLVISIMIQLDSSLFCRQ